MIIDWKLPDIIKIIPSLYTYDSIYHDTVRVYYRYDLKIFHGLENHDGKWWTHVSISHTNKLPSWKLLKEVKMVFIGRFRKAIQILPSEKNYVNVHPYCLHLFHSQDDGLPDFAHNGLL